MRSSFLALPSLLLASLVLAIPPPTSLHQQEVQQHTRSPWQNIANRVIDTLFSMRKSNDQQRVMRPKLEQQPPPRNFAKYGGDLVLRFNISTDEEARKLVEGAESLILDIWEVSYNWVDIRLPAERVPHLLSILPASLQHSHTPLLRERALAQAILDQYQNHGHAPQGEQSAHDPARRLFGPGLKQSTGGEINPFFADYQPLEVFEPWMRLLASLFTTHVRLINIGLSYEGRNIPALRVGVHATNSEDPNPPKRKTILVVGSLHAREWISTTTVNYIAYSLVTGYGRQHSTTTLLENFDFIFIPTLNPDGYVYSWETDRLWRKNRQPTGNRFCPGIDLDRSFEFEWTASSNQCSESYSGASPFQAVEARQFADWARNETLNNNVDFVGLLDLHSYSQQILYPYSYSCSDTPPGLENLEELGFGLGKAIRITHGHNYEILPACQSNVGYDSLSEDEGGSDEDKHLSPRIEPSGGSALDYFYHTLDVRYAYQIKLRDRGTYGFLLPKDSIVPTGKEILNAVLYFGAFMGELYAKDEGENAELATSQEAIRVGENDNEDYADDDDDDEPWVLVEDAEPLDFNRDLKRRRRRRDNLKTIPAEVDDARDEY